MESEVPPLPKERREILEPLTPEQLLHGIRWANWDRRQHIRKEDPDEAAARNYDHALENILEHLVEEYEDPRKAASEGRLRRSMGFPEKEVVDLRETLQWMVSSTASRYWDHLNTGHVAPRGSSEEYLRERVQRECD